MSIRKKIAKFIEIVTINEILEKTNIKRSTLYRVKNEEIYSIEVIEELFRVYTNLNPHYFFLGKGNMFLDSYKLDESNILNGANEEETEYQTTDKGLIEQMQYDIKTLQKEVSNLKVIISQIKT